MSAVVDAVEDVGDAFGDAFEWIGDEIVEPVVDGVGDFIDQALDDPVKAVAQIAAIATGNAWALPIIEGIDVAEEGGSFEDVAKAVVVSAVAQQVGSMVGNAVSSAVTGEATAAAYGTNVASQQTAQLAAQEAGMQTAAQIAGNITGSMAASTSVAVITGQDPLQAMITGGVNAAVPAILGQVDGFQNLSNSTQRIIEAAVKTQLAGGTVTDAIIRSAIISSQVTSDIIKKFDPDNKLSAGQQAILADVLSAAGAAAFTKGNVSDAIQQELFTVGSKALGNLVTSKFKTLTQDIQTKSEQVGSAITNLQTNESKQQVVIDEYNNTVGAEVKELYKDADFFKTEMQNLYTEATDAINKYKRGEMSQGDVQSIIDRYNMSRTNYEEYIQTKNEIYDAQYRTKVEDFQDRLNDLITEHGNLVAEYESAENSLTVTASDLKNSINEIEKGIKKSYVSVMDPNFNESEYVSINKLGKDVDPYEHWLSTGQYQSLPTNAAAAESAVMEQQARLLSDALGAKNLSISNLTKDDQVRFYAALDKKYGDDYVSLKNADVSDLGLNNIFKTSSINTVNPEVASSAFSEKNKPADYTPPAGYKLASEDDIFNNKAILMNTVGGFAWLSGDPETKNGYYWNPDTGEIRLKLEIVGVGDPIKVETHGVGSTLENLQTQDPLAWMYTVGTAPEEAARKSVGDYLYDFARKTMDLARETGNSTIINAGANALKAGGGILKSFNGLVTLAGMNPNNTAVGKFAEQLVNLGKASNTEEYKAALAAMDKTMRDATGIIGTGKAIWKNFTDFPVEFLAEVVGVEGMQELVPLFIGGGAATAAKGLAIAKNMGTEFAERLATKAGISAAMATDIAESVGGSAANAFDESYNAAIKSGKSEAEATTIALNVAARTGVISGVVTATTLGIGGNALESVILGKKGNGELAGVIDEIGNHIKTGTKITLKEGVTEGVEEGLTQGYLEGQLYQLDPTRDVAGNITSSTIIGAIAGGGVSGGAYSFASTGNAVANVLLSNPEVVEKLESSRSTAHLNGMLNNLGIKDPVIRANILNSKFDPLFTSSNEARAAFEEAGYVPTIDEINQMVGTTRDDRIGTKVQNYVDPLFFDAQEIKAIAESEGYTLTDEQALALARQTVEATAADEYRAEIDPLAVTQAEAEAFFGQYGITPTADDLARFVVSKPESEVRADALNFVYSTLTPDQKAQVDTMIDLNISMDEAITRAMSGEVITDETGTTDTTGGVTDTTGGVTDTTDTTGVTDTTGGVTDTTGGVTDTTTDTGAVTDTTTDQTTDTTTDQTTDQGTTDQATDTTTDQATDTTTDQTTDTTTDTTTETTTETTDTTEGGAGNDTITGGTGNDTIAKAIARQTAQQRSQNLLQTGLGLLAAAAPTVISEDKRTPVSPFLTSDPRQKEFESPLAQFFRTVESGSYSQPSFFDQPKAQKQDEGEEMPNYFTYGEQTDIDRLFSPFGTASAESYDEGDEFMSKRGGLATPLMASGGLTRYGRYAGGGLPLVAHSGKTRVDFRQGDAVTGPGDGQSDDIPAMLADGEFVIPADVVAALGNGSTKAGSDKLYDMMHSIRAYHRSAKPQDLPPEAKPNPLDYLKKSNRKARR